MLCADISEAARKFRVLIVRAIYGGGPQNMWRDVTKRLTHLVEQRHEKLTEPTISKSGVQLFDYDLIFATAKYDMLAQKAARKSAMSRRTSVGSKFSMFRSRTSLPADREKPKRTAASPPSQRSIFKRTFSLKPSKADKSGKNVLREPRRPSTSVLSIRSRSRLSNVTRSEKSVIRLAGVGASQKMLIVTIAQGNDILEKVFFAGEPINL